MSFDAEGWRAQALAQAARYVARPLLANSPSWELMRKTIEGVAYFYSPPKGLSVETRAVAGIETRFARPEAPAARLLWLHGGGFTVCSPESHAKMTDQMAIRGLELIAPDYRLAPEHPFPAGYEDCLAVARQIASEGPFSLGGDSAGGGLAAAVLGSLLAEGIVPDRVVLLSPAADFDTTRPIPEDANDLVFTPEVMFRIAADYAPDADPRDPRLSPIHAAFPDCPPVLIHCCRGELLEGDSDKLAEQMRAFGGEVTLEKAQGLPHVWHMFAGLVPAADQALDDIAAFLKPE